MASEKTFWDIIQTALALIGGTYALVKIVVSDWRRLFGTPKLKIYLPPAVGVIVSGVDPKTKDLDYIPPRLHLRLTIFNNSPRVAVIDRMEAVVKDSRWTYIDDLTCAKNIQCLDSEVGGSGRTTAVQQSDMLSSLLAKLRAFDSDPTLS